MSIVTSLKVALATHTRTPSTSASGIVLLAWVVVLASWQNAAADEPLTLLPQDHDYQVVLRDYLASLTESDFELALEPMTYEESWVETDEQLHRLWLVARFDRRLNPLPSLAGLRIAADNFVLKNIEGDDNIYMRAGHRGGMRLRDEPRFSIQPADTVWWATWDYPGNPYYDSQAVRNRAFAVAAVDMMMLDHLHESGTHWVNNARRSDFLGGTMIWLSYVYHAIKDDLPADVRSAYETGLTKFVQRLTDWGPTGVNDNMDMKTNVAMAYVAATVEDEAIVEQAWAYIDRNLHLVHPAGMIRDAGGLDASYNGIALVNIIWAAMVSKRSELIETVQRMSDLKAHLTFPEPDGETYFGPSHFSTRTGHGSPNDQWSRPYRDVAAAMIADEALYLMFGGRRGRDRDWASPDRATMLSQVQRGIDHINDHFEPSDERFTRWVAGWWPGTVNYAHDHYHSGFYERLIALKEADDPLTLLPWQRPDERFIRAFPDPERDDVDPRERDTFLTVRFDDYGAVLYTGPIGNTRYMNFAGGSLSTFWTPDAGSVILGRTGHPVHPDRSQQTWEDWRLWPTHALSGTTPDGDVFTSARLRRRVSEVEYVIDSNAAKAVIRGPIGADHDDSRTAQNKCIQGLVSYQRTFDLTDAGIDVETRLYADGTDEVAELLEIIPLFLQDTRTQGEVSHKVHFQVGDEVREATDEFVDGITAVRIERFNGGAVIEFDEPQRVRLAAETWTDTYQSRVTVRNVHIDLLRNRNEPMAMPDVSVRYRIRPLGAEWKVKPRENETGT